VTTTLSSSVSTTQQSGSAGSAVLRDTWVVFARAMRLSLRNPTWVIIGLTQPILYLVLFGPLLKPMAGLLGGNAWRVFVPGMLVQLGIFGGMFVGFGLIAEWRAGVIESMRVTPANRLALLMGRVLRDVVVLVVQAVLLTVVAIPLGLRAPFLGVVVAILVVGLLGAAFSAASYAVALTLKSEDALAPLLNGIAIPVLLLSGILLPMTLAPRWLRDVSDVNPLKHVVDGLRAMFRGDLGSSTSWWGLAATVGLVVVGLWFGRRTFRRESA
jgi:ABC-2 type transport system permease protein